METTELRCQQGMVDDDVGDASHLRLNLMRELLATKVADAALFLNLFEVDGAIRVGTLSVAWEDPGAAAVTPPLAGCVWPIDLIDPRCPRPLHTDEFLEDRALAARPRFRRSTFYRALLEPMRLAFASSLLAYEEKRFVGCVALLRREERGAFDSNDRRALRRLVQPSLTLLREADRFERASLPPGPGYLVFSPGGRLELSSEAATGWLAQPGLREGLGEAVSELGARDAGVLCGRAHIRFSRLVGSAEHGILVRITEARAPRIAPEALLTRRQREVAAYAAAGATVSEIARQLGVSSETVHSHLQEIYRRLEISSRIELVVAMRRSYSDSE